MSWDIVESFDRALSVVRSGVAPEEGLRHLLASSQARFPSEHWKEIAQLDVSTDVAQLDNWFMSLVRTDPPGADITAFWFGLFDPILEDDAPTRGFYASGSTVYQPGIEDPDWACDTSWWSERRYVRSKVLETLYAVAVAARESDEDLASELDYTCCLAYAGLWVVHAMRTVDAELLLGAREWRAVGFGFDSGDLTLLGTVTETGFELSA